MAQTDKYICIYTGYWLNLVLASPVNSWINRINEISLCRKYTDYQLLITLLF